MTDIKYTIDSDDEIPLEENSEEELDSDEENISFNFDDGMVGR